MSDIALVTAGRIEVVELRKSLPTIAAVDVTAGQIGYLNANGKADLADSNGSGTTKAEGMFLTSAKAGCPVTLGVDFDVDGFDIASLAYGAYVYTSNTAGAIADAAGSASFVVGHVIPAHAQGVGASPDKLLRMEFDRSYTA